MKKYISSLALIVCLTGSFAFAGDKKKSKSNSEEPAPQNAQAAYVKAAGDNPCPSDKKAHRQSDKPSPSQEQQFDEVLRGIYG